MYRNNNYQQSSGGRVFTEDVNDKQLTLACNYFKFEMSNKQNNFFKYSLDILPELPQDSKSLRGKVWDSAKISISKIYGNTIYNNTLFYSQINIPTDNEIPSTLNGTTYKLVIKWVQTIEKSSSEFIALFKKFYNLLLRKISFIQIRRNYYNPKKATFLNHNGDLEVWPGFVSSVNQFREGAMLNIQTCTRLIRTDTAWDMLNQIIKSNSSSVMSEANDFFKGCVVITRYNGDKSYILDGVDFSKTPINTFQTKDGEISFRDYYLKKYGKQIKIKDQPLLIYRDRKTDQVTYLVPELCIMSGITDEMRQNFNLMKDLTKVSQGNANKKVEECKNLIQHFNENEKCKEEMKRWGIRLSNEPLLINAVKIDVGNILLAQTDGKRNTFNIEGVGNDLDRKIQAPMFSQPSIKSWIIFAGKQNMNDVETLLRTFGEVKSTFGYEISKPNVFYVDFRNKEWMEKVESVNPQIVLCILHGPKGKGFNYNEIKRYLLQEKGIPSQMIILSTITKGKNLRSIINKVLMQMCAKIGGEPWAIDKMPFTDVPTCIASIDFYEKSKFPIMSVCLSVNRTFTKYCSVVVEKDPKHEVNITNAMKIIFENFKNSCKTIPHHIIMLRDGISPNKAKEVGEIEIKEINQFLEKTESTKSKKSLTYIVLNKKSNLKIFISKDNCNFEGCQPGTIVDSTIVNEKCFNEFFMISQLVRSGCASATHYNVMFDSYNSDKKDIFKMVYKLCYLYYNWTGGIKVPAPCQYSRRLALMVGEKLTEKDKIYLPEKALWQQFNSLYFL